MKPETCPVRWKKVTVVGVGLLGGSLGLALRQRRLADCVAGYVRRASSVRECEHLGAVDFATRDLGRAVSGADLVVLCTPIAQMRPLALEMAGHLTRGAIVTDVGSVKETLVRDLEGLLAPVGAFVVGSHPMAGAEKMGVAAARADLFANAICVVTPTRNSDPRGVRQVEQLWKSVGARVVRLSPTTHDRLVSRSSHLPHVVAAQLANFVLTSKGPKEPSLLCANGFRDTTRIASGSPEMWRDIALANRENILRAVEAFGAELDNFQRALKRSDGRRLLKLFQQAKARRDAWSHRAGSPSPE